MSKNSKSMPMARTAGRLRSNIGERSIVLVGLMGAGKSTIGKRVAQMLELDFCDTDHEIVRAAQMTIPELFTNYGEQEFRDLEKRVILRLLGKGPMVLATGGGAYMNDEIRAMIRERGVAIWLSADLDTLMTRVLRKNTRPLLQNDNPRAVMEKLMNERYPVYAQAELTVTSRNGRRDVVARDVIRAVDRYFATQEQLEKGARRNADKECNRPNN